MGTRLTILTLVGLVGWAPLIHAADEPDELMPGKVAVIKPGKLAKFVAKPAPDTTFDLPDATNDPTTEGGQLAIFDTSPVGPAENTYALPGGGWTAITGGKGYKYKGTGATDDPCKVVLVKSSVVKAACRGAGVTLTVPFTGEVGIVLTVGTDSKRYCASFGGTGVKNDDTGVKRKDAAPPSACPTADMCTPGAPGCGWSPGDMRTYNQNSWGDVTTDAGALLNANFSSVYGSSVVVGGMFTMTFTSASNVFSYLPALGTAGVLTGSLQNPTMSSAGEFGGEVLALRLNVDFSAADLLASSFSLGDLRFCNFAALPNLDGQTVDQFLATANAILGGGSGPFGATTAAGVARLVNNAFVDAEPSSFAQAVLVSGACP